VPWTKPDDLDYDPNGPLPELPCLFHDGFRACEANGAMCFVRKDTDPRSLRRAIDRWSLAFEWGHD
jgi:hypothetical protein